MQAIECNNYNYLPASRLPDYLQIYLLFLALTCTALVHV
jgi:hypothetical protein